jgi:uncharacterized protein with HEPN domain
MTFHLDLPYLNYILDIIKDIEESIKDISKDEFLGEKDIRDANVRRIEIIAETIKNMSSKTKNKYKNVGWEKIATIKDRISSHYFGINFDAVFELLKNDLPIFKEQILKIKKDLENHK